MASGSRNTQERTFNPEGALLQILSNETDAHMAPTPPPPPIYNPGRPRALPSVFETEHMPCVSEINRNCVVCYKLHKKKKQNKVVTYCGAPQCQGKYSCVLPSIEIVLKFFTAGNIIASNSLALWFIV